MLKKAIIPAIAVICLLLVVNSVQADLNTGLFAYYPFTGNAYDESGNSINGTVHGALPTTDRFINPNSAYHFDGNWDYIEVGTTSTFNFIHDGSDFSISAWEKHNTDIATEGGAIAGNYIGADTKGFCLAVRERWINFTVGRTSPYPVVSKTWENSLPAGNNWNHIVITYNNANNLYCLYVNGNYIDDPATPINPHLTGDAYYSLKIGTQKTEASYGWMTGDIDDVRIYKRALLESEIQTLYDGYDNSLQQGDIQINIKDDAGNLLNGYLLIKLPPPNVFPNDLEALFYPYFTDNTPVTLVNGEYNIGYLLKCYYVRNGLVQFNVNNIEDIDMAGQFINYLSYDNTRFLFFYPTDEPLYGLGTVIDPDQVDQEISTNSNGDVTWWTLHYRASDESPLIQYATMVLKDEEGIPLLDWTEGIFCSGTQCYFPDHDGRQNYVLEAPSRNGSVYAGEKPPVVLIHGINGQAGYWEDNILKLKENPKVENAWVFNYRGTDTIDNCAYLLKLAVDDLSQKYEGMKINLATHSYGGVVSRYYCTKENWGADQIIDKVIMFGPPHHGAYSAERVYVWDHIVLNQRLWLGQDWTLDPMSPVYGELTPGSDNLMKIVDNKFPEAITPLVVAGTGYHISNEFHDEAPEHDDGVVSISSASLLSTGVPLYFIDENHESMVTHADTAELIAQVVSGSPIPVGGDKYVNYVIEDPFPRLHAPTYQDEYPSTILEDDPRLDKGGLIVDCRNFKDEINKIEMINSVDSNYVFITLDQRPNEGNLGSTNTNRIFYYYQRPGELGDVGNGLAHGFPDSSLFYHTVKLNFYSSGQVVASRNIKLYPCSTTVYNLNKIVNIPAIQLLLLEE